MGLKHQLVGDFEMVGENTALGHCSVCGARTRFLRLPAPTGKDPMRVRFHCVNQRAFKGSKYHAKPMTTADGVSHASTKEGRRWEQLRALERAGEIENLKRQVSFSIVVNGHRICRYVADFCYVERGKEVVEDVKGYRTREYGLKKKLMRAVFGVEIRET